VAEVRKGRTGKTKSRTRINIAREGNNSRAETTLRESNVRVVQNQKGSAWAGGGGGMDEDGKKNRQRTTWGKESGVVQKRGGLGGRLCHVLCDLIGKQSHAIYIYTKIAQNAEAERMSR
jgi:hypothetical protein